MFQMSLTLPPSTLPSTIDMSQLGELIQQGHQVSVMNPISVPSIGQNVDIETTTATEQEVTDTVPETSASDSEEGDE